MAKGYLIDTCSVIKYLNDKIPKAGLLFMDKILEVNSIISFISEIELQVWQAANTEDIDVYMDFIANSSVLKVDDAIIKQTIKIRKKYKLKIPDAIIAATAMTNDLTLISDNDKDFTKIYGLQYLNPMGGK